MEIHERFMKLPTTGVNIVESLASNSEKKSLIIRELMEEYNKKISNNVHDLRILEIYRMILCYEYQSLVYLSKRDGPPKCKGYFYTNLRSFFLANNEYPKREEFAVLYDIVVLQLVLSHRDMLLKSFKDFWNTEQLLSSTETKELAIRVIECFADSYNLHNYLYKSTNNSAELEEQFTHIMMIIISWIKQEEGVQWKLLASLLPKLTITFDPEKIVTPLWSQVIGTLNNLHPLNENKEFSKISDVDKKLAALCAMADVCFPSEKVEVQKFHYEQCVQDKFWCILNQGLISTIYQQRKQALYLMKRAVEFVEIHKGEIKGMLKPLEKSTMPFICTKSSFSFEKITKNFFLILEVLEEKQKHLVLPALSHLPSFVKIHADHKSQCDCYNPIWLCCILRRIAQHDNDSIKILGLREILKSNAYLQFDNEFLNFLVDSLNNTFLYDCSIDGKEPVIVKDLVECLFGWELSDVTLINSFIRAISSVTWGPVALYWILEALLTVSEQCKIKTNVWTTVELRCVEELIKKNVLSHNLQLRNILQIFIVRLIQAYASMSEDFMTLEYICDIITLFSENENLKPHSKVWIEITQHLRNVIKSTDAVKYVTQRSEKFFTDEQRMKSFALIITLLLDSKLILIEKHCPADKALRNIFQILVGADLRPYADQDAILKVIEFSSHLITHVLDSRPNATVTQIMKTLMLPYVNEIVKIVSRSLERKTISAYDEYLLVISALIRSTNKLGLANMEKEIERFEDKCIFIIANPQNFDKIQWLYAMKMLHLCNKHTSSNRLKSGQIYVPPLLQYFRNEVIGNEREDITQEEGKFTADCIEYVACLLDQSIALSPLDSWPCNVNWFQELLTLVETGDERVIIPVASTLNQLIMQSPSLAIQNLESVDSIIRVSWRSVFQLKKTQIFISAVERLALLIVSEEFLKLDGAKEYAIECVEQLMREGENVPSLKRIFLSSLKRLTPEFKVYFQDAFTSCLLHGAVPRRDKKIERATILRGRSLFDVDHFSILDVSVDTTVRASAIEILLSNILSSPEAARIRKNILNELLEILVKNKNKRYFDNSHLHRLKHRVMQNLLLMEPFLNEAETLILHDVLCDLLITESNQPSVRLMQEWLLIRLHLKDAELRETIWTRFETAAEERPGSIVSLASVVFHVARLLSGKTQTEYVAKAIIRLLPNCMGQQFNVRLYSEFILVKIYEMLPMESAEFKIYREIFNGVEESLRRGNLMKNSTRISDDFFFKIFDPILDYNLETIYYELPRLTNVSIDEWIVTEMFEELSITGTQYCREDRRALRTTKPYVQSSKPTGELTELADSSQDCGLSDIQKKIIPWKTMVPFYDDLSEISKAKLLRRKMQNEEAAIIVVASLIDRPPNLGGLARTCEIFGAKELVIGSLRYAEDREFQTLSVSAEKWLTITEVKPHLLQNYLLEKQSEGWKLVGAEQTANSTNLLEMEFPKKTVLLLGNEKDGVPANLIPLLDTCVEIPQNGVVRSLNVHVTGAICIWEYAKQHVLT